MHTMLNRLLALQDKKNWTGDMHYQHYCIVTSKAGHVVGSGTNSERNCRLWKGLRLF
jgi:hypothetical protein